MFVLEITLIKNLFIKLFKIMGKFVLLFLKNKVRLLLCIICKKTSQMDKKHKIWMYEKLPGGKIQRVMMLVWTTNVCTWSEKHSHQKWKWITANAKLLPGQRNVKLNRAKRGCRQCEETTNKDNEQTTCLLNGSCLKQIKRWKSLILRK